LPDKLDNLVEAQQRGKSRVQRLRSVLQAAQHEPPTVDEEGGHPEAQAEAKEQRRSPHAPGTAAK